MKFPTLILFLTTFCIIAYAALSQARHIATQYQTLAIESSKHSKTMIPNEVVAGECSYMTSINTSCNSPASTNDKISVVFGDASGKKVFVDRLDDPASGRFNRCSTVTLAIKTTKEPACLQQICLFYLVRYGMDGWMPETVTIAGPNSLFPLRILYNTSLPEASLFGVNTC